MTRTPSRICGGAKSTLINPFSNAADLISMPGRKGRLKKLVISALLSGGL
jgi:hypothetical protein